MIWTSGVRVRKNFKQSVSSQSFNSHSVSHHTVYRRSLKYFILFICISTIDHHLVISLQFKIDIHRDSRCISVLNCSDIPRDWCPLYQIVKDTSKIDNGYQLFKPAFGYKCRYFIFQKIKTIQKSYLVTKTITIVNWVVESLS